MMYKINAQRQFVRIIQIFPKDMSKKNKEKNKAQNMKIFKDLSVNLCDVTISRNTENEFYHTIVPQLK